MITFKEFDVELSYKREEVKIECLSKIDYLYKEKSEVLKRFLKAANELMAQSDSKFCDLDELETLWSVYGKQLKSLGGNMSGCSRKYKSTLAVYFLTLLKKQNSEYFKYYTNLNYQLYSKFCFNTSPTKKTLLTLIDNSITWQEKNRIKPHYANKKSFLKYLDSVGDVLITYSNDEGDFNLSDKFKEYYRDFHVDMNLIKLKHKKEYNDLKNKVDDLFAVSLEKYNKN